MNVQIETLIQKGMRMVIVSSSWVTWVVSPLFSALREVSIYPGLVPEEPDRDGSAMGHPGPGPLLSNVQVAPQFSKACSLILGLFKCQVPVYC